MQARTRVSRWMDRILCLTILFILCYFFFVSRLSHLLYALLPAAVLTVLAAYCVHLTRRRFAHRSAHRVAQEQKRRAALYALTMLPYREALDATALAMQKAYPLTRLQDLDGCACLLDPRGLHIALGLHQSPQRASIADVHAFHRARGDLHGVLVCAGDAAQDAQDYALTLSPPLKLLPASALTFPDALSARMPMPEVQKQRRAADVLAKLLRPEQAPRCMMLGFLLIVLYLLTGWLTGLFPALALVFWALVCKGREGLRPELF